MGAGEGSSPASGIVDWGVEVFSRSDTRLLMKLSLVGMNDLGASCLVAEEDSSVFSCVGSVSAPPKGTTEGAAASSTGASLAQACGSAGTNSESESEQLRTEACEASADWPLSSHFFLLDNKHIEKGWVGGWVGGCTRWFHYFRFKKELQPSYIPEWSRLFTVAPLGRNRNPAAPTWLRRGHAHSEIQATVLTHCPHLTDNERGAHPTYL